jgi:hypothetical protein
MRRLIICFIVGAALLSGCGVGPTQNVANTAGTAVSGSAAATAVSLGGTAASMPEAGTAAAHVGTAASMPEVGTAAALAGTAVSMPDPGTAQAIVGGLTATEADVTIKQGEALVLDASKSVGDIKDYKWTIMQAPTGAESVVGQTIKESSSGNVSLNPDDYAKYFPKPGQYTVRLTVTDAKGATSNDDFMIEVP